MLIPQLFGILPAGSPLLVQPTSLDEATSSLTYHVPVPAGHPFTHLAIFLLPGATPPLPPGKAASVYVSLEGRNATPASFIFVGGVGPEKQSGIFKVASARAADSVVTVGIVVEDEVVVSGRVAEKAAGAGASTGGLGGNSSGSNALVQTGAPAQGMTTLQLAQAIITHAFNHLASHGQTLNGIEIIPLKAFQDWWNKFEARIRRDPGFLERRQE